MHQGKGYLQLSNGEYRVLRLLADGHTNKTAAAEMGLTLRTVRQYLANARRTNRIHRTSRLIEIFMLNHAGTAVTEFDPTWKEGDALIGGRQPAPPPKPGFLDLTDSQRKALDLMREGWGNSIIAEKLDITEQTLLNYLRAARIRNKIRKTRRLFFIHRQNCAGYPVQPFDSKWEGEVEPEKPKPARKRSRFPKPPPAHGATSRTLDTFVSQWEQNGHA